MNKSLVRQYKNSFRRKCLALHGIVEELQCQKKSYGQGDGSWVLNPEKINTDSIIYSFGIGRDLSLEMDLIDKHGVRIHAFDPTPVSLEWVSRQTLPTDLIVHDYGISCFDGNLDFQMPRKQTSAHFSPMKRFKHSSTGTFTAPVKRLSTIMLELGHKKIDLLKIDIEGGEYDVISNFLCEKIAIEQLLVEFHHNYSTISLTQTLSALSKLRDAGFKLFSISDRTYEMSMIK